MWNKQISRLVHFLSKKQRTIMTANLTKVYGPERIKGQYWQFGIKLYENLTLSFTDYGIWGFKRDWNFFKRHITVKGEEHLREAYARGKGVLCLVPHTAGWEFSAILPPLLGYKTAGVSRAIKNPAINKLMVHFRESRGMRNIPRDHCYDQLVELLRNGECLIIMTDQDSKHIRGEFVEFLGFKAYTPIGCSRLAAETGAAVVPMFTIRNSDNTYTFNIYPELKPIYAPDGSYDIIANTKLQNDVYSQIILEYPEQWVWMHKRWDTTPEVLEQYLEERRKAKQQKS